MAELSGSVSGIHECEGEFLGEYEEEENMTLPELLSVRSRCPFADLALHSRPSPPSVYTHLYMDIYILCI